jgi:glycosyltransferase involved in cell wall biosynthesis
VVTCHDLLAVRSAIGDIPPQKTRWSGRRLQSMILTGLGNARHIVCVSDSTRDDVLRIVPDAAKRDKITRIYNGLNYPYAPMDRGQAEGRLSRLGLPPHRPFLLHVGGNQWYKNRPGVIDIFARLRTVADGTNLALVTVGKPWTADMRQLILSHKLQSSVVELSNVVEEDLRALYSSAELMLFPSLAEGFGWPVVEAQACGCIVATSNFAPMTEVGGDAAIYVDPADPESAALKVARALRSGPCLRTTLRQAGLRNAARFSAASMIAAYLKLYQRLAEGEPASPPRVYASAG